MAAVPYIHNVGKQVQKLQNSTLMDTLPNHITEP